MSRTKIIYSLQKEGYAPVETVGKAQTIKTMTNLHIDAAEAECLLTLLNAELKAENSDTGIEITNKFNEVFYFSATKKKVHVIENNRPISN